MNEEGSLQIVHLLSCQVITRMIKSTSLMTLKTATTFKHGICTIHKNEV